MQIPKLTPPEMPAQESAPKLARPNVRRDEASSSIPPLPRSVDSTGEDYEAPSWKPLGKFSVSILLPLAIGVFMLCMGYLWAGLGFLVIAAIFVFGFLLVGFRFSDSTLKAPHRHALTSKEQAALSGDDPVAAEQARRVEVLGGLLGREGTGAYAVFSSALAPADAAVIERNRVAEADATYEWAKGAGKFQRVETPSADGLRLYAHVLRCAPASRRWALLAHGYNGDWNEMMLYARHYAERGFNLLMPEMRGHGDSEGEWVGMGWPDRLDLVSWASWLVGHEGADIEVVLHGHSMGAASVCMASAEEGLPSQVKATVSDCAYTDALNVFRAVAVKGMGMSAHPLLEIVRAVFMIRGGYDLAKAAPVDAVPKSRVPLCLFHGEQDSFVPPYMAHKLDEAAGGAAAGEGHVLTMVPGAGHAQSVLADPELYWSRLFGFVEPLL
jgi:fermentation-respiration switch protein FrsA (DUF1100 family)